MQPSLKFKIDPAKDWEVLQGFLRDSKFDGGRNLEWAVYAKHPSLKKMVQDGMTAESEEKIKDYIQDFFATHATEIKENMKFYESAWRQKQPSFYRLIESIFGNAPWPTGLYEVYPTVWGMFPRSLENKTFQVPAIYDNKPYVNIVIAHELLHFMFYSYLYAKYPEYNNKEDNFLTWNTSEIFNSLVQNSTHWLEEFGLKTMTYPEHEKIENELRERYPFVDQSNLEQVTKNIIEISKLSPRS